MMQSTPSSPNTRSFRPILISILVSTLGWTSNWSSAATIEIAADPWCPFTCNSKEKPGVIYEIAQEIFSKNGHQVKITSLNWARAVTEARSGRIDAIAGALKGDAPDFIFPKIEQAQQVSCFFSKKPLNYKDLNSLNGLTLGAVLDYTYGGAIDEYIQKNKKDKKAIDLVSGTETTKKLFLKLTHSRIDVMVEDRSVFAYFAAKEAEDATLAQSLKPVGCGESGPLFVAFSPAKSKNQSSVYAQLLSDGMTQLKKSGKLKEIFKRYGL